MSLPEHDSLKEMDTIYSELDDSQKENFNSLFDRISQENNASRQDVLNSLMRYLFIGNAGGAVAILGYLGGLTVRAGSAQPEHTVGPFIALALYLIGAIFVLAFFMARYYYLDELVASFGKDIVACVLGKLKVFETLNRYEELRLGKNSKCISKYQIQHVFGWSSFIAFIAGSGLGFLLLM